MKASKKLSTWTVTQERACSQQAIKYQLESQIKTSQFEDFRRLLEFHNDSTDDPNHTIFEDHYYQLHYHLTELLGLGNISDDSYHSGYSSYHRHANSHLEQSYIQQSIKTPKIEQIVEQSMPETLMRQFRKLPQFLCSVHSQLLCNLHLFAEIEEGLVALEYVRQCYLYSQYGINNSAKNATSYGNNNSKNWRLSPKDYEMKHAHLSKIKEKWQKRLPNKWEGLDVWSDVMSFRCRSFEFSAIIQNVSDTNNIDCTNILFYDRNWTRIRQSMHAGENGCYNSSLILLQKSMFAKKMSPIDFYYRTRQQVALACMDPEDTLERYHKIHKIKVGSGNSYATIMDNSKHNTNSISSTERALHVLNISGLKHFNETQKSELFCVKAEIKQKLGQLDEANGSFSASLAISGDNFYAWNKWGKFCDGIYTGKKDKRWAMYALISYLCSLHGGDNLVQSFWPHNPMNPSHKEYNGIHIKDYAANNMPADVRANIKRSAGNLSDILFKSNYHHLVIPRIFMLIQAAEPDDNLPTTDNSSLSIDTDMHMNADNATNVNRTQIDSFFVSSKNKRRKIPTVQNSEFVKYLYEGVEFLPPHIFLNYIPQLLQGLFRFEVDACELILREQISYIAPQLLFYFVHYWKSDSFEGVIRQKLKLLDRRLNSDRKKIKWYKKGIDFTKNEISKIQGANDRLSKLQQQLQMYQHTFNKIKIQFSQNECIFGQCKLLILNLKKEKSNKKLTKIYKLLCGQSSDTGGTYAGSGSSVSSNNSSNMSGYYAGGQSGGNLLPNIILQLKEINNTLIPKIRSFGQDLITNQISFSWMIRITIDFEKMMYDILHVPIEPGLQIFDILPIFSQLYNILLVKKQELQKLKQMPAHDQRQAYQKLKNACTKLCQQKQRLEQQQNLNNRQISNLNIIKKQINSCKTGIRVHSILILDGVKRANAFTHYFLQFEQNFKWFFDLWENMQSLNSGNNNNGKNNDFTKWNVGTFDWKQWHSSKIQLFDNLYKWYNHCLYKTQILQKSLIKMKSFYGNDFNFYQPSSMIKCFGYIGRPSFIIHPEFENEDTNEDESGTGVHNNAHHRRTNTNNNHSGSKHMVNSRYRWKMNAPNIIRINPKLNLNPLYSEFEILCDDGNVRLYRCEKHSSSTVTDNIFGSNNSIDIGRKTCMNFIRESQLIKYCNDVFSCHKQTKSRFLGNFYVHNYIPIVRNINFYEFNKNEISFKDIINIYCTQKKQNMPLFYLKLYMKQIHEYFEEYQFNFGNIPKQQQNGQHVQSMPYVTEDTNNLANKLLNKFNQSRITFYKEIQTKYFSKYIFEDYICKSLIGSSFNLHSTNCELYEFKKIFAKSLAFYNIWLSVWKCNNRQLGTYFINMSTGEFIVRNNRQSNMHSLIICPSVNSLMDNRKISEKFSEQYFFRLTPNMNSLLNIHLLDAYFILPMYIMSCVITNNDLQHFLFLYARDEKLDFVKKCKMRSLMMKMWSYVMANAGGNGINNNNMQSHNQQLIYDICDKSILKSDFEYKDEIQRICSKIRQNIQCLTSENDDIVKSNAYGILHTKSKQGLKFWSQVLFNYKKYDLSSAGLSGNRKNSAGGGRQQYDNFGNFQGNVNSNQGNNNDNRYVDGDDDDWVSGLDLLSKRIQNCSSVERVAGMSPAWNPWF